MTLAWRSITLERPDRYLDWEFQNRKTSGGEEFRGKLWSPVLLQAIARDAQDMHHLLSKLAGHVSGESVPELPEILMNAYEIQEVDDLLSMLENLTEEIEPADPLYQFYAHVPEENAYVDGEYSEFWLSETAGLRIRMTAPVVQDMTPIPWSDKSIGSQDVEKSSNPLSTNERKVAIGVIDDGIAFANARFLSPSIDSSVYASRIRRLWLQEPVRIHDGEVRDGRIIHEETINDHLRQAVDASGCINEMAVYRRSGALAFDADQPSGLAWRRSHGTHVMDLACGYDPDDPDDLERDNRPILAVELPRTVTAATSGIPLAFYALRGLRRIINWADRLWHQPLPLVVNFSYGFQSGPKDGHLPFVREIDRLVQARERRNGHIKPKVETDIVIPAGNSFEARLAANFDSIKPGGVEEIDWIVHPDDFTESYLEIWLPEGTYANNEVPLEVTVTGPGGPSSPAGGVKAGYARALFHEADQRGEPVCGIYFDLEPRPNEKKRPRIFIALNRTNARESNNRAAVPGCWKIKLRNISAKTTSVNLGVQRDDTLPGVGTGGRQSFLEDDKSYEQSKDHNGAYIASVGAITGESSLNALASGIRTSVVGALRELDPPTPSRYSSSGPTARGPGPGFSALADDGPLLGGVYASGTLSGTRVTMNGTSVAAPQVVRALANGNVGPPVPRPGPAAKRVGAHIIGPEIHRTPRRRRS